MNLDPVEGQKKEERKSLFACEEKNKVVRRVLRIQS